MELETDDDQHSDASDDQHTDDDWHADDYFHVDDYYCYTDDYWHVDDNDWHIGPRNEWKLEVLPPVLQAVKDRFPPGSEWLWRRCNEILDPWGPNEMDITTHERARALNLVLHNPGRGALTPYPLRPSESLPSSESVDKLRAILAQAVRIPINADGEDEIDGLDRHETWDPEWDISYDWTMNYRDEVSEALFGVFKQHGAGEEGWASARWEVYDTYAQCIGGICYERWKGEVWKDGAKWWLTTLVVNKPEGKRAEGLSLTADRRKNVIFSDPDYM